MKVAVINANTMKSTIKILYGMGLMLLAFACSPDEPGPIGEPANKVNQIRGTWEISRVVQVDLAAEQKGFPTIARTKDITNALPGMSYAGATFRFDATANGPGSFDIDKGNSPLMLPATGTWAFNDPQYPSAVVLTANGSNHELEIASFAQAEAGVIVFKVVRSAPERGPYVRYEYYLNKVSE
ncbi:hypothetical protein D770_25340 [Flammeovirgaceae bacterium 311]|nr:hypothetical protein D770_25340 [Flammeovirgaceae bacterium 311]